MSIGLLGEREERAVRAKQLRARAEVHRRRLARQGGFGLRDLDAVSRELVQHWSWAAAGWEQLDPVREPELYLRAANVVSRSLAKVAARLHEVGLDSSAKGGGSGALDRHIRERYGENGGGS